MNVMLLAAGEGTRLRPYTNTLPKPAIPFLTVPLAGHALSFLSGIQIDKLVVNTFHLPQKIHELFHTLPHGARSLHFSDEVGEILGSGGGLGKARSHFIGGGDFIMMNADEVILPEDSKVLEKALWHHKKSKALSTLLVMDHPGVGSQFGGVWANEKNSILGFGKSAFEGSHKAWHFVGVQILSERIFDYIPTTGASNILYDAVTAGIAKGEVVQAYPFEGSWFETGNPQDYLEASHACLQFLSPKESYQKELLFNTLMQYSSEPLKVESQDSVCCLMSENFSLDKTTTLEEMFIAGPGSVVGAHCRLKNVIIGSGVVVPDNTVASDTLFL